MTEFFGIITISTTYPKRNSFDRFNEQIEILQALSNNNCWL